MELEETNYCTSQSNEGPLEKGSAQAPFTISEFEELLESSAWSGGYVENIGYQEADPEVNQNDFHIGYTNTSYFYGWYDYGNRENAYNLTEYPQNSDQISNCSDNDDEYFDQAIATIDNHLRAGRPIIAGVIVNGRDPYDRDVNRDGCQHFIVITEKTSAGYRFVDCASSNVQYGCSVNNIFAIDYQNNRLNGYSAVGSGQRYTIAHIRPNM